MNSTDCTYTNNLYTYTYTYYLLPCQYVTIVSLIFILTDCLKTILFLRNIYFLFNI